MVSQSIRTHIVLEVDGSGYMLCVFSDSVDRTFEGGFGGQIDMGLVTGYMYQF